MTKITDKDKQPGMVKYIASFPKDTQKVLRQIRSVILKAAPGAAETISYGIFTFTFFGNLVHFAGYKNHIGFYPAPSAIKAFEKELSAYPTAKGSVQFPMEKPLPVDLIIKMVKFRVQENEQKALVKTKGTSRTCPRGHTYIKSSSCPVCPVCEKSAKPERGFLAGIPAPARRALENNGITSLRKLSGCTEDAIISLHGIGPSSLPKLKKALAEKGMTFKKQ